ncbi:lymphotoxin alpha [Silurus meridionalis]|nr:lymphotoxin alpha [Silurus meridionalis]
MASKKDLGILGSKCLFESGSSQGFFLIPSQKYLGKWYYIGVASWKDEDIDSYKSVDNSVAELKKGENNTLIMAAALQQNDQCNNMAWTYQAYPNFGPLMIEGGARSENTSDDLVNKFKSKMKCGDIIDKFVISPRTKGGGKYAYSKGYEQKSVDYIHLVWAGNDKSPWKQSTSCFCANTSLHLQNDSVIITTGGFYHTYAQVTFMSSGEHEGTVTLVANEKMPGKVPRKLSEAEHRYGTVSMSGVFRLRHGDSVKLNISRSPSVFFSKDASKTYWGLLLLKQ